MEGGAEMTLDMRFRPPRPFAGSQHDPHEDQRTRTHKSIVGQCMNSRIPGYTGYIPSARAEDVYGKTTAAAGRTAAVEQARRREQLEQQQQQAQMLLLQQQQAGPGSGASTPAPRMVDEHPLGASRAQVHRNHWVPTVPGYSGFIPGKHAENVHGGGVIHTCKMAGRAIAARSEPPRPMAAITLQDGSFYYSRGGGPEQHEKAQLATNVREHCSRQIPGYTGHIPRVHGESIFGATAKTANLIAADFMDDRILNPSSHGPAFCAPQFPGSQKLRP